jgi:hypothetical protein
MMAVKVSADTGWTKTARCNSMRGFSEYQRVVIFEDGSTYEDMDAHIKEVMAPYTNLGGPTWTNINKRGNVWRLLQGTDSSD